MASVTKRGKKWSLRYRVTDERGVVTHHRVSFDTKEEAWENARRLESASEAGVNVHGDQMTCGQLMEKWYAEHAVDLAIRTQIRYSEAIEALSKTFIYDTKVKKVSKATYSALIDDLSVRENGKRIASSTVRVYLDPLRYAMNWAVKSGLILRNPLAYIPPLKVPKREQKILNENDIKDLLDEACIEFRIPMLLAVYGGLRRGECAGLKWSDIDFQRNTLTIQRSVVELKTGERIVKASPKTAASRRTISLPRFVMAEIDKRPRKSEFVCLSKKGMPYDLERYSTYMSTLVKRTNEKRAAKNISPIPQATFHDLRHTHAAILIKLGIQPKIISERLGHTSISVTMDTYGYLMEGLQTGVAEILEQQFQKQTHGNASGNTDPKMGTKDDSESSQMKRQEVAEMQ